MPVTLLQMVMAPAGALRAVARSCAISFVRPVKVSRMGRSSCSVSNLYSRAWWMTLVTKVWLTVPDELMLAPWLYWALMAFVLGGLGYSSMLASAVALTHS
jgi:hypothetical protein